MRKYWIVLLQAILSLVLIGKLALDDALREEILQVLRTAHGSWLLAGFCTAILSELACAVRWWFLLRALGTPIPFTKVLIFCGAGLFFSLSLPGGAGGDAFRILYGIQMHPGRKLRISLSVLGDRLCGLAALLLVFLASDIRGALPPESSPQVRALIGSAQWVLGGTVLLMLLWWLGTLKFTRKLWIPDFLRRLRKKSDHFSRIFMGLASRPKWVFAGVCASFLSLAAHFNTYFCSARAFDVAVEWLQLMRVMPVVDTLVMLPISFSGVGLRELLFERLLGGLYGVPSASAVLTSMGGFVLQVLVAGVGGMLVPFTLSPAAAGASGKVTPQPKG